MIMEMKAEAGRKVKEAEDKCFLARYGYGAIFEDSVESELEKEEKEEKKSKLVEVKSKLPKPNVKRVKQGKISDFFKKENNLNG